MTTKEPSTFQDAYENAIKMEMIWEHVMAEGVKLEETKIHLLQLFLDTFLWNAADVDSWNQWDTSSRFSFYFYIENYLKHLTFKK